MGFKNIYRIVVFLMAITPRCFGSDYVDYVSKRAPENHWTKSRNEFVYPIYLVGQMTQNLTKQVRNLEDLSTNNYSGIFELTDESTYIVKKVNGKSKLKVGDTLSQGQFLYILLYNTISTALPELNRKKQPLASLSEEMLKMQINSTTVSIRKCIASSHNPDAINQIFQNLKNNAICYLLDPLFLSWVQTLDITPIPRVRFAALPAPPEPAKTPSSTRASEPVKTPPSDRPAAGTFVVFVSHPKADFDSAKVSVSDKTMLHKLLIINGGITSIESLNNHDALMTVGGVCRKFITSGYQVVLVPNLQDQLRLDNLDSWGNNCPMNSLAKCISRVDSSWEKCSLLKHKIDPEVERLQLNSLSCIPDVKSYMLISIGNSCVLTVPWWNSLGSDKNNQKVQTDWATIGAKKMKDLTVAPTRVILVTEHTSGTGVMAAEKLAAAIESEKLPKVRFTLICGPDEYQNAVCNHTSHKSTYLISKSVSWSASGHISIASSDSAVLRSLSLP